MKNYYGILHNCGLFTGISESNLKTMLDCLTARQKAFKKNSFIFLSGDRADSLGVILSGAAHVMREDFWGRRKIVSRIGPGELFGEAFACAGAEELPVSVMAAEDTEVLLIRNKRIVSPCAQPCRFHTDLNKNLITLLAEKNIALIQKMEYITQPTTRKKLLAYFSEQARLAGSSAFNIPFNREELADYLSVERSAMSAELSKMQNDGIIVFRKNHFRLKKNNMAAL